MKIKNIVLSVTVSASFLAQAVFAAGPMGLMDIPKGFAFTWSNQVVETLNLADAKKGKTLAKKYKCAKCHGDNGVSEEDDTPSIAGQTSGYIMKQLVDYKQGQREDRSMKKAVKKLNFKDMADIGAFYAMQTAEKKAGGTPPKLVTHGDKSRLLLACNDCHNESKDFRSQMEIPATLDGQKPEYFLDTMMAFKEGDRANDLFERMRFIAERLTDEEIEAISKYYSAKPMPEED